jgi:N-acyl-D-amino-acid deacylase
VDARGHAVAPGFVDIHSHSDLIATQPPDVRRRLARGKLLQGITTEIAGNCGLAPAPVTDESRGPVGAVLSWMTPEGSTIAWKGFAEYLETVEAGGMLPLNTGFLAAHGPIRAAVLGMGRATPDAGALARMAGLVEKALRAGAFGLSTGLIYPPGLYADTDELAACAEPVARHGALFTSHVRGSSETLLCAVEELIAIGRRTGARVHHSHSEAVGPAHWDKIGAVLEMEEAARSGGIHVTCDLFPYHAAATSMLAIYPPWSLEGGPAALLARLRDPGDRARIRRAVELQAPQWPPWTEGGWPHNLVVACGWGRIFVARTGGRTAGRWDGLSLTELARARGQDPFDAVSDLVLEEEGEVGQLIFGITGEEGHDAPLVRLLGCPHAAIATDACDYGTGLPHPAAYGAFPRILGSYVRERGVVELGEALRRMTSLPASIAGITGRGVLRPGAAADIVIFDPVTIADRATFENPRREAAGILHVFVNGVASVADGAITETDGGVLLRRA